MPTPTKGRRLGGSPAHQRHILANLATALSGQDIECWIGAAWPAAFESVEARNANHLRDYLIDR